MIRLIVLTITAIVVTAAWGCASSPAQIRSSYTPDLRATSPLESLRPLTLILGVEDLREVHLADRIGTRKNAQNYAVGLVKSSSSPAKIVFESLSKECMHNGLQLATTPTVGTKTVKVMLKKYWVENETNFLDITMSALVTADVSVTDAGEGIQPFVSTVTGTARDSRQIATESAYEETMNAALADFIYNFSRDPGLLKALKSTPNK